MLNPISWLAGILEGEGSFYTRRAGPGARTQVSVGMTDEDIIRRAAAIMGATVSGPHRHPPLKPIWTAQLNGLRGEGLMYLLYPHMGSRRQHQIERAITAGREARERRRHSPTIITPTIRQQVVSFRRDGLSMEKIARDLGMSSHTVWTILHAA